MKLIINGVPFFTFQTDSDIGSNSTSYSVNQVNAFSNYQAVYFSGAVWALAQANAVNTMGTHVIKNVTAFGFDVVQAGKIVASGHGLGSAGDWLYVSEGTAGLLTTVPPTIYSNPLAQVLDADTLEIFSYLASKIAPAILFSQLTDGFSYTIADSLKVVRIKLDGSGLESAANNATIPDPMPIIDRTTDPAIPAAGFVNLYPKTIGCKSAIFSQDRDNNIFELQESTREKDFLIVSPLSGTSLQKTGGDSTTLGVISHPTIVGTNKYWQQVTLATANDGAGMNSTTATFWGSKGFSFYEKHYFPDADYGSGATGVRFAIGFANAILTTTANADDATGERACFAFSTNLSETNWMFSTKDGTTEHRVSTGITFVAQHIYKFYIETLDGTSYKYRIDDITAGTSSGILTATLNLPAASTALFTGFGMRTLTTTVRTIQTAKSYTVSRS